MKIKEKQMLAHSITYSVDACELLSKERIEQAN